MPEKIRISKKLESYTMVDAFKCLVCGEKFTSEADCIEHENEPSKNYSRVEVGDIVIQLDGSYDHYENSRSIDGVQRFWRVLRFDEVNHELHPVLEASDGAEKKVGRYIDEDDFLFKVDKKKIDDLLKLLKE